MFLGKIFICTFSFYLVVADSIQTVQVRFSENDIVTDSPWGPDKQQELGELVIGATYPAQDVYQRMITLKNPDGEDGVEVQIMAVIESGAIHYLRVRNAPDSFAQVLETSVKLPNVSFTVYLPPDGKYTVLYVVLAAYKYRI